MEKIQILFKDNYLSMIKNSQGTKIFRDFFGKIKNKKINSTDKGRRSCAFFVSSILYHFNLIKSPHLTVDGTIKDMRKSGWFEIKKPKEGSIILWEKQKGHYHIGFYLGGQKAISNNRKKRMPTVHHFTFSQKRRIENLFSHRKIS